MNYRTKERKIADAAEKVRQAAAKVALAHHKSEAASELLYAAKNDHNNELKAYRAVVEKLLVLPTWGAAFVSRRIQIRQVKNEGAAA